MALKKQQSFQKKVQPVDKPGSVVSHHLSRSRITSRLHRPTLPVVHSGSPCIPSTVGIRGLHGLSACKVYLSTGVTNRSGELLPHLFTFLSTLLRRSGCLNLFSTGCIPIFIRTLPVRKYTTLRCPDFPRPNYYRDAME